MLSFFSRKPFNSKIGYYDTKLSKYVIDTTNKVNKDYQITRYSNYVIPKQLTNPNPNPNHFIPIISMLSFLAGYYFSKYNN
jgi:hypothetical protein